jgi:hypothetical protein
VLVQAFVIWGRGARACLLGHNIYELLAPQLLKKRSSATVNVQLVDHSLFSALVCIVRLDPRDAIDRFNFGFNETVNGRERWAVNKKNGPAKINQYASNSGGK